MEEVGTPPKGSDTVKSYEIHLSDSRASGESTQIEIRADNFVLSTNLQEPGGECSESQDNGAEPMHS